MNQIKLKPKKDPVSDSALLKYKQVANLHNIETFELKTRSVSEEGENSYGLVLQVMIVPTHSENTSWLVLPDINILKIAPKDAVRRQHMEVVKHYRREVFMYDKVLTAFSKLFYKRGETCLTPRFHVMPRMEAYSLEEMDEFIILEDLSQSGFRQNPRHSTPTYDLVETALEALAQLHARSLLMQHTSQAAFKELADQLADHLFTRPRAEIPIMFGKYYIKRAYEGLEEDELSAGSAETNEAKQRERQENRRIIQMMKKIERNFKEIVVKSVDGKLYAPYAVICHGDFSNNNILYKYGSNKVAKSAKLVDFQMSCYSPPVCDVLRYIFTCTEKSLRDLHFQNFMNIYHSSLVQQFEAFGYNSELYPRDVFDAQMRQHGAYAFIIASFAMPYLLARKGEFPKMDKIAADLESLKTPGSKMTVKELVHRNNILTRHSIPIFKRRMSDIMGDLIKYGMVSSLLESP